LIIHNGVDSKHYRSMKDNELKRIGAPRHV
jgi:hypothetical protein